jgi:pentapeptide repeat protein
MNVAPKDVAATGFKLATWREELLAVNPWAQGLTIDESNAEFAAMRQKATLARHAEGKDAWNAWAGTMLALRSALESAGQRSVQSDAAGLWRQLAVAAFSTQDLNHRFETDVSFVQLVFAGAALFEGATFSGNAEFRDATFGAEAVFKSASFGGTAVFRGATFASMARFSDATFNAMVGFWEAAFNGEARFNRATFSGRSFFRDVRFNGTASFVQTRFEQPTTFLRAVFRQRADFEGMDSSAAFSLADASFHQVPSFLGATFKGVLRLDNVRTPRYGWLGYTPDKDARARFRELRRRAVEAQDRGRELEFFAQEFRTGRFHSRRFPSWVPKMWHLGFWLGLAFEGLSNFGRSLWRPLLWWLVLAALFAAFFLGEHEDMRRARSALAATAPLSTLGAYVATTRDALARPPACRVEGQEPFASTDAVTEAIQLSLRNALVFDIGRADSARRTYGCLFGLEKDGDQQYLRVSARVSTAATLQALASGLLIFLFLLAVRNLLRLQ